MTKTKHKIKVGDLMFYTWFDYGKNKFEKFYGIVTKIIGIYTYNTRVEKIVKFKLIWLDEKLNNNRSFKCPEGGFEVLDCKALYINLMDDYALKKIELDNSKRFTFFVCVANY